MKGSILLSLMGALLLAMSFSSCRPRSEKPVPLPEVRLVQEWFPYSGFAGEVSAATRFARSEGINLVVTPGSEQLDPIKLVLSGSADIGVVSSDLLIAAVAKGAPLKAIGVINNKTPTCFLVLAKSQIRSPSDFPGNRVGILVGTNTERVYDLMMKNAKVQRMSVKEVQIPFDLQTFVLGQYDVRPAFVYDEPVSLEQQGIGFRIIDPTQYGVRFMGTVYFARTDFIAQKPALVQSAIKALVAGWQFALDHPQESIQDLTHAFPDLQSKRELRSLTLAAPYFRGTDGRPLTGSDRQWAEMIGQLESIGVIPAGAVTPEEVWQDSFVKAAYGGDK